MGYVCLSCYEEYNKNALNLKSSGYEYRCPKATCGDLNLIEIDDLILPVIKELNKKGYITRFCCSGHSYDYEHKCNTYISFDSETIPSIIPKGFVLEDEEYYKRKYGTYKSADTTCIRKWHKENYNNSLELQKDLFKTMNDLIKWVLELEDLNE